MPSSSSNARTSRLARHFTRRPVTVDDVTIIDTSVLKRAVGAAALGNAMEWFDFAIYGYLAAVMGAVFFPSESPQVQLLYSFGAFAVAFLVRPLGGLFFGPLGDRVGRQQVLAATMIMMAISTFSIGLIPSHESIGVWAPLLLLLARLVQGFSTGGEYGGAATFIAEYAPDRKRGFLGSWLEVGTLGGFVLGAGLVNGLTWWLGSDALHAWAWRIPFLVAGPLGLVGLYLRLKLEETPAFRQQLKEHSGEQGAPINQQLRDILSANRRPMLLCLGLVFMLNIADYMLLSYMPSYLTATLGYSETGGLFVVVVAMLCMMVITPFVGALSDRIGRRPIWITACVGFFFLSVPCFMLIGSGDLLWVFGGLLVLGVLLVCLLSIVASTLPALFPTAIRYGGLAIAYNLSTALFGGTAPLLATWLVDTSGDHYMPAFYLMLASLVGFVAIWYSDESARQPLQGSPPAAASRAEAREIVAEMREQQPAAPKQSTPASTPGG
ncbi:glycine betaine/L-proline transporter ProP [Alloalcanivorax mobilis]|uniref:glycine betaine/L-proline transporter ProP n=1 Tax=Alloalcanivorax mobilis TaxID=2019569 RepID=UPI000B5B46F0|nr:glycine betaine/L-proline transporter ProP [Alloalcanivorax mobilis]ASK34336.1 proline/betaine transporter [Alcanivorax sp. N3-2A]|tara:strand:- start:99722 stop:101206 length:1485 start_codon:yes stop_codon:yes gene_type:complete